MRREEIMRELVNRGYDVESVDVEKNGVIVKGIRHLNGTNIQPTVYVDQYNDLSLEDAVEHIIKAFGEEQTFDTDTIFSEQYILENIRVGYERHSDTAEGIRKPSELDGIDEYLYVDGDGWIYRVKPEFLKSLNLTARKAWTTAYKNTSKHTSIKSMFDTFKAMAGIVDIDDIPLPEGPQMFVLTNDSGTRGASAWTDKKSMQTFAELIGVHKFAILPSSIHEMIVVPWDETMDIESLNAMVREVNATQVDPVEQLSDHAYVVEI